MFAYIEDILHYYVDSIVVDDANNAILNSISKQCKRGIALTDRQHELVKNKLLEKADLLAEHGIDNLDDCLTPRVPLRQIDRKKYISIVDHGGMLGPDSVYESYKENWVWIKIRFPFSKKLIVKLDQLKTKVNNRQQYHHVKGTHEHYFKLNGEVAYWIVEYYKNSSFEIDDRVLEYYNQSKEIIENSSKYCIEYADGKFKNLPEDVVKTLNNNDALSIADNRIRYGYTFKQHAGDSLVDDIAYRSEPSVCVNPEMYSLEELTQSLKQLNRFPMIVMIDNEGCFDQVKAIHNAFSFIDNSLQSILFRVNSETTYNLNDYIKDNSLNNWVDINTKIVYIKKSQLPKVVFTSDFAPTTAFALTSYRSNTMVENYIKFNCDLIVFHDKEKSMFGRYATKYGLV